MVELVNLPMPPIANHRLMPSQGRLIKSPDARMFDRAIDVYILRMKSRVYDERRQIKEWIDVGYFLHISLDFYWSKEKVLAKNGSPKRNDLDGRLKSSIDAIANILDFDDKYLIEIHAKKLHWDHTYDIVNARIKPIFWSELCS